MSTSVFNRRWAAVLLEALARHGVRHVCIAPGSRSTPLTLAAAANRSFICHTHFDERGLGHLALGLAKAAREPVAVIVTSGTAAANLYPALIEAGLTGERLVFLTADRPPELIDCGANQAIRQNGLYSSHPTLAIDLPRPTPDIPAAWLASSVDSAMARLQHGALHINCPFAEPLYGGDERHYADWSAALGDWWQSDRPWLQESETRAAPSPQPDWFSWRQKRGVVLAGRMSAEEGAQVADWAETLGWPLIGDVLSQTGQPLPCADLWLAHPQAQRVLQDAQLAALADKALTAASTHLHDNFGEAQLAHRLPELLPENGQLFLGNSLVVRLIDALTMLPAAYPVFSNRGASGIDGLISTAAGVQRATAGPTLAVVGDLSALYDLNALALLRHCSAPTVLIVVNNNGGQIFSLLPTPEEERQRFYCMPQNVEFSHAAAMFQLDYARPENWRQLQQAVEQGWRRGGATLIELQVPLSAGAESLQYLVQQMAVQ
ncbi:2-succinyl-5-enolpyruvyl-6-hydroxy-3-cyclohexene-1-carboxylic-acid synthase [Serratia nematodiphila]